jgi:hypothetical protein
MVSLRPCRTLHSPAFDRFDEILYLVEKASDLTLTDFRPLPPPRFALLLRSRTGHNIRVLAFADVRLTLWQSPSVPRRSNPSTLILD